MTSPPDVRVTSRTSAAWKRRPVWTTWPCLLVVGSLVACGDPSSPSPSEVAKSNPRSNELSGCGTKPPPQTCANWVCDTTADPPSWTLDYTTNACNDGNPCTYNDTCDGAGACV